MKHHAGALLVVVALLGTTACSAPERASAFRITSRDQLIGGPGALGDLGDYLLENGKIRVIIQDVGFSRGFAVFGGGLIDADLVRPQSNKGSQGGNGKDLMGEMFPAFFLEALDPKTVTVVNDGTDGEPAMVRVAGRGNEFLAMTEFLLKTVLDPETLRFETDYVLKPGANYVEITSRVINDDARGYAHEFHNIEFSGTSVPIPMGDALLFSEKTPTFVPGDGGFDQRMQLEERYGVPIQLPALPGLVAEFLAATGEGVSYGLLPARAGDSNFVHKNRDLYANYPGQPSDHSLVVPFTASSLMPAYYAYPPELLPSGEAFEFKRYFIVGSGDVASVADTVHTILGDATGTFSGRVLEKPSLRPMAQASVLILNGLGSPVDQVLTDDDGLFRCTLRPGTYSATIVADKRRVPGPTPFAIEAGRGTYQEFFVDAPARLVVNVTDADGRRIPARATLVGTTDERDIGVPHHKSVYLAALGESFRFTDMVEDTADPETRRYIEAMLTGTHGSIVGEARPGRYQVYISRGPEYAVSVADVELKADQVVTVAARLERVVDTSGYISADFHLHSQGSIDSAAWLVPRVIDAAAEGLEVAVSTDHNYIVDYSPTIAAQELQPWLYSIVGIELTTLEMGHFNAFPLRYQTGPITHGAFEWAGRNAGVIFDKLREAGDSRTLVQVNHPRDTILGYFYQFRFDNERVEVDGQSGLIAPNPESHPEFMAENFSWNFDAIEVINGKHIEQVHDFRVPDPLPPPPLPAVIPPAGEVLRDENGQIAFFGVADDWMSLLESGRVFTGTANSDSHTTHKAETGYPRTYVRVPDDDPAKVRADDIIAGLRAHDVIMTHCPFVTLRVGDVGIGGTAHAVNGRIGVDVDVQTASWCRPDRVNIYLGKRLMAEVAIPLEQARHFTTHVDLPLQGDSFVIAEVVGSHSTFPVLPGEEVPSIDLNKALSSLGDSLGLSFDNFGNLRPARGHPMVAFALTNPIFIDADGDGDWEPVRSSSSPLTSPPPAAPGSGRGKKGQSLLPPGAAVRHPYFAIPAKPSRSDIRRVFLSYGRH
ncbi:MAG: CehA/McbA family metallohydrolase [Pseudomonadota bacterium]